MRELALLLSSRIASWLVITPLKFVAGFLEKLIRRSVNLRLRSPFYLKFPNPCAENCEKCECHFSHYAHFSQLMAFPITLHQCPVRSATDTLLLLTCATTMSAVSATRVPVSSMNCSRS